MAQFSSRRHGESILWNSVDVITSINIDKLFIYLLFLGFILKKKTWQKIPSSTWAIKESFQPNSTISPERTWRKYFMRRPKNSKWQCLPREGSILKGKSNCPYCGSGAHGL